jgi:orotidine-5'-phosphate decarboxylase
VDDRLIVALDVPDLEQALELVERIGEGVGFYKVGVTLYTAAGPAAVERLRAAQKRVFLDLKLHDIPVQVAGAVAAAAAHEVDLLTVHTAGGEAMLTAAARAASTSSLRLLGVTVLTSQPAAPGEVEARAERALAAGLDGVVCSPLEVGALRARLGDAALLVTPGIRPAATDAAATITGDDQVRTATPAAALRAGATHLVVGRPITTAADPPAAVRAIIAAMQSGVPQQ